MATYTDGRTPLTPADFITRLKTEDPTYANPVVTPDFYTAFKSVMAELAHDSTNEYFRTVSQATSPTAMPTATIAGANGNVYEIPFPADARNGGIEFLTVSWGTTPQVVPIDKTTEAEESAWSMSSANTDTVYWRQGNRFIRAYVPSAYSSSTPKYSTDHWRIPAYPTTSSDVFDYPAEEAETLYQTWKNRVVR